MEAKKEEYSCDDADKRPDGRCEGMPGMLYNYFNCEWCTRCTTYDPGKNGDE